MKTLMRLSCCVPLIAVSMVILACDYQGHIGQQVFQERCSSCHNANSSDRKMGPGLKGLFHRERLVSDGQKVTEANVRAKIHVGGKGMPAFEGTLSDEDIKYVVTYLKTF